MNAQFLYELIIPGVQGPVGSNDFDEALQLLAKYEQDEPYTVLICTGGES
jgi:hypothetical protein